VSARLIPAGRDRPVVLVSLGAQCLRSRQQVLSVPPVPPVLEVLWALEVHRDRREVPAALEDREVRQPPEVLANWCPTVLLRRMSIRFVL
jgi:hypothetical protein